MTSPVLAAAINGYNHRACLQNCASKKSQFHSGITLQLSSTRSNRHTVRTRGTLVVQANELNKWAGRSMDDQYPENPFDKETAAVLLRVLTARAVKTVLIQVQEFDLVVGNWLNNYCSENNPLDGNKFILSLLHAKGTTIVDPTTQAVHTVDPQQLAHRILQTRADMAQRATVSLPSFVELENTGVLRSYLESNTYTAGDSSTGDDKGRETRRGYFRKR